MPVCEFTRGEIIKLQPTKFAEIGVEEKEIRDLLCGDISLISDDLYVISPEFKPSNDSKHSIDILCLDKELNIVVIEIKRKKSRIIATQADNYAKMVKDINFDQLVNWHHRYSGISHEKAKSAICTFLDNTDNTNPKLKGVRIVLIAPKFTDESINTTSELSKNNNLSIQIVHVVPYEFGDKVILDFNLFSPACFVEKLTYSTLYKSEAIGYDLEIEGEKKRQDEWIWDVLKFTLDFLVKTKEISPEEISQMCRKFKNLLFMRVPRHVNSNEFRRLAKIEKKKECSFFFPMRYYCKDTNDLIHCSNGNTYAVRIIDTEQDFLEIMNTLKGAYEQFNIKIKRC